MKLTIDHIGAVVHYYPVGATVPDAAIINDSCRRPECGCMLAYLIVFGNHASPLAVCDVKYSETPTEHARWCFRKRTQEE